MFTVDSNKFKKEDLGDVVGSARGKKKKSKYKSAVDILPDGGDKQGGKTTLKQVKGKASLIKSFTFSTDLFKAKVKTVNGIKVYAEGKHTGKRVGSIRSKSAKHDKTSFSTSKNDFEHFNDEAHGDAFDYHYDKKDSYETKAAKTNDAKKKENLLNFADKHKKSADFHLDTGMKRSVDETKKQHKLKFTERINKQKEKSSSLHNEQNKFTKKQKDGFDRLKELHHSQMTADTKNGLAQGIMEQHGITKKHIDDHFAPYRSDGLKKHNPEDERKKRISNRIINRSRNTEETYRKGNARIINGKKTGHSIILEGGKKSKTNIEKIHDKHSGKKQSGKVLWWSDRDKNGIIKHKDGHEVYVDHSVTGGKDLKRDSDVVFNFNEKIKDTLAGTNVMDKGDFLNSDAENKRRKKVSSEFINRSKNIAKNLNKEISMSNTTLAKAITDSLFNKIPDLNKGGEGSRGGKIIGHTKSGKPIYHSSHTHDNKDFTNQDHFDAHLAHGNVKIGLQQAMKGGAKLKVHIDGEKHHWEKVGLEAHGEISKKYPTMSDLHEHMKKVRGSEYKKDTSAKTKKPVETTTSKNLNKEVSMSNTTLAKAITDGLFNEIPDLNKGKKLDEKKEEQSLLEGLHHHLCRARWKKSSIKNHEERIKDLPEIKEAQKKHLAMAKKYGKKIGIPEKEIIDEVEGKTQLVDTVKEESFSGHYADKKIES